MCAVRQCLPAVVVRCFHDLPAEAPYRVKLGCGSGGDYQHPARDASLARRERDSLRGVASTHRPDPAPTLCFRQQAHRVVGTPDLKRPNRLQALELQVNLGGSVVIQAHEWRANGGFVDMFASVIDHPRRDVAFILLHRRKMSCHDVPQYLDWLLLALLDLGVAKLYGHLFYDFDSETFERCDSFGPVCQQSNPPQVQIRQNLRPDPNLALDMLAVVIE